MKENFEDVLQFLEECDEDERKEIMDEAMKPLYDILLGDE